MIFHGQDLSTGGGSTEKIDDIIFHRYFRTLKRGTALEAGANDGLYLSTCLAFEEIGWKVINVEASKNNYNKLIENRPESTNHHLALSDKDGETIEIYHFDFDNGGMDGSPKYLTDLTREKEPAGKCKTLTARYDTLIKEPIDLFVLDVEGMELQAISGMGKTKYWPYIMCVEYPHVGAMNIKNALADKYAVGFVDNLNMILVRK
jgi:FkbM family methyltransferase